MVRWLKESRNYLLVAVAVAAAIGLFMLFVVPDYFWHPLGYCPGTPEQVRGCKGYNLHSGIGANLQELTMVTGILMLWLKHNCYEHTCPRIGRVKGDDGHLRCKKDHKAAYRNYGKSDPS